MTEKRVPVAVADAHAPVGERHVPPAVVHRSARARADEIDEELLFAHDTVFSAMCPKPARAADQPEAWAEDHSPPRRSRYIRQGARKGSLSRRSCFPLIVRTPTKKRTVGAAHVGFGSNASVS